MRSSYLQTERASSLLATFQILGSARGLWVAACSGCPRATGKFTQELVLVMRFGGARSVLPDRLNGPLGLRASLDEYHRCQCTGALCTHETERIDRASCRGATVPLFFHGSRAHRTRLS